MAKLVLMLKNKVLREVQVGADGVKIGREADNDIQIENPAVSRCHAEVYRQGYPFYIEDKKSTNGTYLNGAFVSWKAALTHNDKITIGKHTLVFVEEAKDSLDKPKQANVNETLYLSPEDLERLRNG